MAPVLSPQCQPLAGLAGWEVAWGTQRLTWGRVLWELSTRLQTLAGASVRRAVTLTSRGGVPGALSPVPVVSLCSVFQES